MESPAEQIGPASVQHQNIRLEAADERLKTPDPAKPGGRNVEVLDARRNVTVLLRQFGGPIHHTHR
jgi:hypothetical protein